MKHIHQMTIRLNDEAYQLAKESTSRLGTSINELINILLSMDLPIDFSDLAAYRYMKSLEKVGESDDAGRN